MATTYEYIISLQDKMSGTMQRITGASSATAAKISALSDKARILQGTTADLGGTIFNLKQKIDLLQQEKELINPANMALIRRYNKEIAGLSAQIDHLDNAGKGGRLKGYFAEIGSMAKTMLNPVTIGAAAIGFAGGAAMKFDQDMAKVNITAQLDEAGLDDLKGKLKKMARDNRTDVTVVPDGFEKIISQTGDVDSSLQILDASLKGSKAGFVDLDSVTGALAQTLSIVGTKNAGAQEVLDTFFAAKRVGAGEFKDFAAYMPGLIAGADSLGINYKSVAGTFAYMTGKGQDAARASVLMGNMFSVLGKTDITKNLDKVGVKIFDAQGKMRGMVDIFKDLGGVMAGMTDEQKSGFLEKIGIVDKEAKSAFAIMGSDIGKLSEAMDATANSTGETAAALELSQNPIQKATELWGRLKGVGLEFGTLILPVVNVGMSVLGGVLMVVQGLMSGLVALFGGWKNSLLEGNPIVWALTAALIALGTCYAATQWAVISATAAEKAKALWSGITTGATTVATVAQWAYNTALYACPIVWIVAAIGALVGAIVWAWNEFEGFRKAVMGVWEVVKAFGKMIWDSVISVFRNLIDGLGAAGRAIWKLFSGDFTGAAEEAAVSARKLMAANPIVATVETAVNTDWSGAWEEGTQAGADSWARSQQEKADKAAAGNKPDFVIPPPPEVLQENPGSETGTGNYAGLMKKIGGGSRTDKGKTAAETIDLNDPKQNYKSTASYSAIVSRLSPVKLPDGQTGGAAAIPTPLIAAAGTPAVMAAAGADGKTDNTDYRKDSTNWLERIHADVRRLAEMGLPSLLTLQKIAATAALPVAVAGTTLQPPETAPQAEQATNEYTTQATTANTTSRPLMERFCDNLNISIQNADNKGYDQIRREITDIFEQIINDYEA